MQATKERETHAVERRYYQDQLNKNNEESLRFERTRQDKQDEIIRELLRQKSK